MNNQPNNNHRGGWGSRLGFVLAAAGSAVGLGNIWGFPTAVAQNGGGGFVLVYILCILLVALPVMLAEMVIGRAGERNPVGAMKHLKPGTPWYWVGVLGVVTGFVILSFYSVIAGWTVHYFIRSAGGALIVPEGVEDTAEYFGSLFGEMIANPGYEILFVAVFMLATIAIVASGVQKGIERAVKIMMPMLAVLLLALILRSVTLEGAGAGVRFYLVPNLEALNAQAVTLALGQAFFSMSLGMGVMITYGSYLSKDECLPSSAGYVVATDSIIAILAGLIVFPVIFFMVAAHGVPLENLVAAGAGLVFVVFPQIMGELPGGDAATILFGSAFFLLLAVAALTSAVSLLEVVVAHFVDDWKMQRKKAAWSAGTIIFVLAIPSALSFGAVGWLSEGGLLGISVFDLLYTLTFQIFLPVGALGLALFVGWGWGLGHASEEIRHSTPEFRLEKAWHIMIRYVAPVAIIVILLNQLHAIFFA
ncbi:MAG: sodium-dependent transporter [Opitutales bacterium]|nr:sodium-dependent transporter [Opitutales bacterium]